MRDTILQGLLLCEKSLRFPKVVDDELIDIWEYALKGYNPIALRQAFYSWIATQTDFPTPTDITNRMQSHLVSAPARLTAEVPALPKPPPITVEEMRQIKAELAARRQSR